MKKILLSFVAIATLALSSFGQSPEGFNYQAVIRDAGSVILSNQAVGMRLTIQQGSIGGTAVYTESFAANTNAHGLVNLGIGAGTTVDDFTTIDWANGPCFMETAVDITGGVGYVVMGTSQLMSVPYALYAKTSGNGPQGIQGVAGNDGADGIDGTNGLQGAQGTAGNDGTDGTNGLQGVQGLAGNDGIDGTNGLQGVQGTPGNDGVNGTNGLQGVQGTPGNDGVNGSNGLPGVPGIQGIAGPQGIQGVPGLDGAGALNCTYAIGDFVPALGGYVFYLDGTGCHGLVADANDIGLLAWDNASFLASGTGDWVYAGENNTAKIVATYGTNAPAATACANSVLAGFSDWYLPSKIELNMMYLNLKFEGIGGFADTFYWSSSEFSDSAVLSLNFDNGMPVSLGKNLAFFVRAIRAF